MGTVASRLSRPFKNWNVENRAHKVISKDKPIPAPTYESTQRQIELVNKLEPDYKTIAATKDPQLDDFLKKVYVNSNSAEVQEIDSRENPNRPLPKDRLLHEGFELGFYVPDELKAGKLNLRQALELLSNHSSDPEKYNVETLAENYKMEPKLVADILEYFRVFHVVEKTTVGDTETVASVMPISLKSAITIPHSIKKKKKKTIYDDDDEDEERAKKLSDRKNMDQIEGK